MLPQSRGASQFVKPRLVEASDPHLPEDPVRLQAKDLLADARYADLMKYMREKLAVSTSYAQVDPLMGATTEQALFYNHGQSSFFRVLEQIAKVEPIDQ